MRFILGFFLIVSIVVMFNSCKKENVCLNENFITMPNDTMELLLLDKFQTYGELIIEIENSYHKKSGVDEFTQDEDHCPQNILGVKIGNEYMKVWGQFHCIHTPDLTWKNKISILMNSENEIILKDNSDTTSSGLHILEIDSISNWIGLNFPFDLESQNDEISFISDSSVSVTSYSKVLLEIKRGYLMSYQRLSLDHFGKKLCQLDENELLKLMSLLNYKVTLQLPVS